MWVHPDLEPQGDPDTVILLATGEALVGLYIRGLTRYTMLGIREDREGQPVSCAVVNTFYVDTRMQSNPRRWPE